MDELPPFLDTSRPDVPDIAVPRGVTPFYLPQRPVRGRLVRLGPLADALLSRHAQEDPVTTLVGQAMALAAALATALKFRGSFSLQIKGDGPVRMLLADCTDTGALRGYASTDAERLAALLAESPDASARTLLGSGVLAFTVDQGADMDRHQGIVAIEGETMEEMALHNFDTSEQMPCFLRLACARTERLLFNLFHSEGVAVDRPRRLEYGCRCSRARLADILGTFGTEDIDHMAEDGTITMTCAFCNLDFTFTRDDIPAATA